jgi:hypothetical protein
MPELLDALTSLCPRIEAELKPYLSGFTGAFIKPYLPQTWVFETREETVTIHVSENGDAAATGAGANPRDVTVAWDRVLLVRGINSGGKQRPPDGSPEPKVTFQTEKGGTAYTFLKGRFGLS